MNAEFNWQVGQWGEMNLIVPIKTGLGEGEYHIYIGKRPTYCDRGDWLISVKGNGAHDLDSADGFPRYFFGSKEEVMAQMETWLKRRQAWRDAHVA